MTTWGGDPLKLAFRPVARFCGHFSLELPAEASIIAGARNPTYRQEFLRRLGWNFYGRSIGLVGRAILPKPTLVTDRPWDNLLVLDACRYDAFAAMWDGGTLPPAIISPGTTTLLWIRANFVDNPAKGRMADVTVIAGNPYMSKTYFQDIAGWSYPFRRSLDAWKIEWDEATMTVPPENVIRAADGVEGRLLAHFYQPHSPFLAHPHVTWAGITSGEVSLEKAMWAYEDNLRLVLEAALKLAERRDGRTIITSDHGELFGEYGLYAHPHGVYVPELVTVPWVEVP